MPPAPPPESLGLGRLVPLEPLLRLLPPDGPQSIELLLPLLLLLLELSGMQFSLSLPLVPLLEPGIPELPLPLPLVLGFVGRLPLRVPPLPLLDWAMAAPATETIAAATGRAMAKRPHSARKRRRAAWASNLSIRHLLGVD